MNKQYHPFHMVNNSPWPYFMSCAVFTLVLGFVIYFHYNQKFLILIGSLLGIITFCSWMRDMIRESTFQGHHNLMIIKGLRLGFILFILSEIFFFVSFFWAFFHCSLSPAIEIGMQWPPEGVEVLNPFAIPLLNTGILLSSGLTVTACHYAIISGNKELATKSLFLTVLLGLIFTLFQGFEYYEAPFTIADSVYGSLFFVLTGFHGLHVIIGTLFLIVCFYRLFNNHFSTHHHVGFELASWYWHFVDVVWILLYTIVYWWGS